MEVKNLDLDDKQLQLLKNILKEKVFLFRKGLWF